MRASYTSEEVEAIKALFTGYPTRAQSLRGIKEFFSSKAAVHPGVRSFLTNRNIEEILEDFFRVGIIGNEQKLKDRKYFHNWYCRKGDHLLFDKNISVHRGLRHTFRMFT